MTDEKRGSMDAAGRRSRPPSLDELGAIFDEEVEEPIAGGIWRAAWETAVQLVLLKEVHDDVVDAIPVTPDVDLADDDAIRFSPGPPLHHDLCAWRGMSERLPTLVLDLRVAAIDDVQLGEILDGSGEGAPITSPLDERAQLRDAIADRMGQLADSSWAPEVTEPVDLAERLQAAGLTPSALAAHLGVSPGDVTEIVRRDRTPSPSQAKTMSVLLGVSPEALLTTPIDPFLMRALDRPRFRRPLAAKGRSQGVTDEAEWRRIVATRELATAARTTGDRDPLRRWSGLIQQYLDEG